MAHCVCVFLDLGQGQSKQETADHSQTYLHTGLLVPWSHQNRSHSCNSPARCSRCQKDTGCCPHIHQYLKDIRKNMIIDCFYLTINSRVNVSCDALSWWFVVIWGQHVFFMTAVNLFYQYLYLRCYSCKPDTLTKHSLVYNSSSWDRLSSQRCLEEASGGLYTTV